MNIIWQKEYSVNVLEIDDQYYQLINFFNDLINEVKSGASAVSIKEHVDDLYALTEGCFEIEEKYFSKLGFKPHSSYKKAHSTCLLKLNLLKQCYDEQHMLINLAQVEGIAKTLLGYISKSHHDFNKYMKEHGLTHFMKAHP